MTEPGALMVLVTAPSVEVARHLARVLVDEGLAACVNVVPEVASIYRWQGRREETTEALLIVKTGVARYEALEQRVLELHPYSVPEVLALPVARGAPRYVQWVQDSVASEGR